MGGLKENKGYLLVQILKEGKEIIENIIKPVDSNYRCTILRAGGYNIMPSEDVFLAMQAIGLKVDSSVYPGGYEKGSLSQYDYRNVPNNLDFWWADKHDITKKEENISKRSIMEIPIFALPCYRWRKISRTRIVSALSNKESSMNNLKSKTVEKGLFEKIKYLFETEAFTWDFCLFNSKMHIYFFDYIETKLIRKRKNFVLIGHPKGFKIEKHFIKLISLAEKKGYSFNTLIQTYEEVNN